MVVSDRYVYVSGGIGLSSVHNIVGLSLRGGARTELAGPIFATAIALDAGYIYFSVAAEGFIYRVPQ